MDLTGASVLVTGGASGLGWASARRLAKRGAQVVIVDLPASAGAERAAELGRETVFAPADVTDSDATLNAARDLAQRAIRVCTIAPGVFDTPILARFGDDVKAALAAQIPHPRRLGQAEEFAQLAEAIIDNPMLNGETIRLDGAQRMTPR
jgi:NAD(P)-dependent dehydrogenase (short-subunit alcohol dehydrogenase family)